MQIVPGNFQLQKAALIQVQESTHSIPGPLSRMAWRDVHPTLSSELHGRSSGSTHTEITCTKVLVSSLPLGDLTSSRECS